jgi:hypothetical protein
MTNYLGDPTNREAVKKQNAKMVITTTKTIADESETTYSFNTNEEHRVLADLVNGSSIHTETLRSLSLQIYGGVDPELEGRIRRDLKSTSAFTAKMLPNGKAVVVRKDGSLRVAEDRGEYEEMIDEDLADMAAQSTKRATRDAERMKQMANRATIKSPESREHFRDSVRELGSTVSGKVARRFELMSADD